LEAVGDTVDVGHRDLYGRRGDGVDDAIYLMSGKIGSVGGCDGRREPLGRKQLFQGRADVVAKPAFDRNFAVIQRELLVEFGVEIRARSEGNVIKADGVEIGGGREKKGQILAIELESY
jgi:hypothetical protein